MTAKKELVLPRLVGSREQARLLVLELGDLAGQVVVLNGRELRAASASSADEFVKIIVLEGGAAALEVLSGTPDFIRDITSSADDRAVTSRVAVATTI